MEETPIIGIDLGTTYSSVAVWKDGKVEIVANEHGNITTPSFVSFNDNKRLIGDAAKNQASTNPSNTIFDIKRLIGRSYDDPCLQKDLKRWPFKVVNCDNKPKIQVEFRGEIKEFAPEEITAMVLTKMKQTAEAFLGTTVKDAVLTVPAYFNNHQRQATKDAGAIAGLTVHRLINEPTAAAITYGLDKHITGTKNVVVFDLGGGTVDVSVLVIHEDPFFDVIGTAGDTHLGGEDFDNRLVDYLAEEFHHKFSKDLRTDPRAMRRLRTVAERAKRTLSSSMEASIEVDAVFDGIDFCTSISRAKFEELNEDLFERILDVVCAALRNAKMTKAWVDDVVLVGGSTRIPKIQELLKDLFWDMPPNVSMNPDEAVAYGAAVQAAAFNGECELYMSDVTPFSLGAKITNSRISTIIERNTPIPCSKTKSFNIDCRISTVVRAFEREESVPKRKTLLGELRFEGSETELRELKVQFVVDSSGILRVKAAIESFKSLVPKGRFSEQEIEKMICDADIFRKEEEAEKKRLEAEYK
jgi:heat shock protein 1/8